MHECGCLRHHLLYFEIQIKRGQRNESFYLQWRARISRNKWTVTKIPTPMHVSTKSTLVIHIKVYRLSLHKLYWYICLAIFLFHIYLHWFLYSHTISESRSKKCVSSWSKQMCVFNQKKSITQYILR
jgi:hypothetical protein